MPHLMPEQLRLWLGVYRLSNWPRRLSRLSTTISSVASAALNLADSLIRNRLPLLLSWLAGSITRLLRVTRTVFAVFFSFFIGLVFIAIASVLILTFWGATDRDVAYRDEHPSSPACKSQTPKDILAFDKYEELIDEEDFEVLATSEQRAAADDKETND